MVKASSCGNSSGHRFGSWFSPKSFFALISYENEHSALCMGVYLQLLGTIHTYIGTAQYNGIFGVLKIFL